MPMEVSIRLVNILVAHDLFQAAGAQFDSAFSLEVGRTALAHARHIASHLEWHEHWRGNHYLAGLVGLAFAAAYLQRVPEAARWRSWLAAPSVRSFGTSSTRMDRTRKDRLPTTAYPRSS